MTWLVPLIEDVNSGLRRGMLMTSVPGCDGLLVLGVGQAWGFLRNLMPTIL